MTIPAVALAGLLRREGGFVNDPADPGGATMLGVTQAVYDADRDRRKLPRRSVQYIDRDEVERIYEAGYWIPSGGEALLVRGFPRTAVGVFDAGVNHGARTARKLLQEALGVTPDAELGPLTFGALAASGDQGAALGLLERRERFYRDLVVRRPTSGKFLRNWLHRLGQVARETGVVYPRVPHAA